MQLRPVANATLGRASDAVYRQDCLFLITLINSRLSSQNAYYLSPCAVYLLLDYFSALLLRVKVRVPQ